MQLLNFFNKALTGYKSKSKYLNGFRADYRYAGKPVIFDPFVMLNNLVFQHTNSLVLNSSPSLQKDLPSLEYLNVNGLIPSVICSMEVPQGKFEVKRFVKKAGDKACSNYMFSVDGQKIAHFSRVYDYAEAYTIVTRTKEVFDQLDGREAVKVLCFDFAAEEKFIIENFGHSHFWHVWNWPLIEALYSLKKINP